MDKKLIARYALREVLGILVMAVALFWSAGRIDWWAAWAAIAVMSAWEVATAIIIFRFSPGLLAERLEPRKGDKPWDVILIRIIRLVQLVRYIVAGLDQRYDWTGGFPLAAQFIAFILCALGYALFVWATASNTSFSYFVHIQSERGHPVARGGPYHYVRHPAYFGGIMYELAVPILLASWLAMIFSAIAAGLLILRTALEDRTLQAELPGYADYASQVRYRLLPGFW